MKKVLAIIGARPQFIKHAPIELSSYGKLDLRTIHTGQHYDYNMSQVFFDELKISKPSYNLEIGSGSHGLQTGKMIIDLEQVLVTESPSAVLVYGDTNSTLAGAITASKLGIPIIHIEAGLRSFNRAMPEEINRVLTDHLSSLLFVPTKQAEENLNKEGITTGVIPCGAVMSDMIRIILQSGLIRNSNLGDSPFIFATLHRPYNIDIPDRLIEIIKVFKSLPYLIRFSVHPRTAKKIKELNIDMTSSNIEVLDPLSYTETIAHIEQSVAVITDSGGIQKESYILKKKCLTLRSETEWVETLQGGWNQLVFDDLKELHAALKREPTFYNDNLYGDGYAADFIIDSITTFLSR